MWRVAISSLFFATVFSCLCYSYELSLNGIVPGVSEAQGYGSTMGVPVGGYQPGNDVDLYTGYWAPIITATGSPIHIATNALIFPSRDAILMAPFPTNISWYVDNITSDTDGTNVLISKITVHRVDSTNDVVLVATNIQNMLGTYAWLVPAELVGSDTNYVLNFEVVDSSSSTNSRTFWNNPFTVVPEPTGLFLLAGLLPLIRKLRR